MRLELLEVGDADDGLEPVERVALLLVEHDPELLLLARVAEPALRKKRSSWASGSGNTPSNSIGFSVARTRNGCGSTSVCPSIVTCRSAIASSSADWVFGIARLISSRRTTLANSGPRGARSRGSSGCRC